MPGRSPAVGAICPADEGEEHMSTARSRLLDLLRTRALKHGTFQLASGAHSRYYINAKNVTLDPEGTRLVGQVVLELLDGQEIEAIGGLTMGADPIVTAVARQSYDEGKPIWAFIVRKEGSKSHGDGQLIEGPLPDQRGVRVAIVDDVVTKGGSILKAVKAAESQGCEVVKVIALVDRLEGGREVITQAGYDFVAVFTKHDLGVDVD